MIEQNIKIQIKTDYYRFYWYFLGLKLIVNITNLITLINLNFKVTLTKTQESDIANKIITLRKLIANYYQDILKYNNQDLIIQNHLNQIYVLVKNFINEVFFYYIFCQINHINVLKKQTVYDIDLYFEYKLLSFEYKLIKQYLIVLKSLNKNGLELEEVIKNYKNKLKKIEQLQKVAHNKAII